MKLLALLLPAVALGAVEQVTDQNTFKRVLTENPAVVVDFFSQVRDARLLWH